MGHVQLYCDRATMASCCFQRKRPAVDAEIEVPFAENSELSMVLSFEPGEGQNIVLPALPAARKNPCVPNFCLQGSFKFIVPILFYT